MSEPIGLDALENLIRHDLDRMAYPAQAWVAPRRESHADDILNCAIIGGGQYGLAAAFALARECVPDGPQRT